MKGLKVLLTTNLFINILGSVNFMLLRTLKAQHLSLVKWPLENNYEFAVLLANVFILSFLMAIRGERSRQKRLMMWTSQSLTFGPSNSKCLMLTGGLALKVRACHSDTTCAGTESYSNWHVSHENLFKKSWVKEIFAATLSKSRTKLEHQGLSFYSDLRNNNNKKTSP